MSDKPKVILVRHNPEAGDDRASTWLAESGYAIEWRAPYEGDALDDALDDSIAGTVMYGGPHCMTEPETYPWLKDEAAWAKRCVDADKPVLGFCLGAQVLAHALGAEISPHESGIHEFGYYPLKVTPEGAEVIPDGLVVVEAHFHQFETPEGAERLASTEIYRNQAFRYGDKAYGFQFHPEKTPAGFRRWQEELAFHYDHPGTQSVDEQNRLMAEHDDRQDAWFKSFIAGLFPPQ